MDSQTASLREIACAVADGIAVDWDAATAAALTPSDRERIGWMRLLAGVASVHREEAQVRPRANAPFALTPVRDTARVENTPDYIPLTHWGGLQIIERIGWGTSGQVYRARDPRLDREVALKLLHDSGGATGYADPLAVVREARMLARVRHANVAAVYGANHADGCVGIWMELVEGRTLEEELRESGTISAADAIGIGRDLCRALDAVHRAGLLHRDVKAQNVMRDRRDGRIVLTDFSAGGERTDRPLAARALPGTLAGSPLYLAPEILGGTPASERSDLYSLGVLLFRVVTGRFPVEGDSLAAIQTTHAAGARRVPVSALRPDLPVPLSSAIERALSRDPAARFASAGEMEEALAGADVNVASRTGPTTRRRLIPALVVMTTAAAVAVASLVVRSPSRSGVAIAPFAERDWALVAEFENRTGDARFDGVLERALERELAGSGFVNLVSRARVEDVLALMKKPVDSPLGSRLAREVALRDGRIRALLTGRIDGVGNGFALTTNVVNPVDDVIVASISGDVAGPGDLIPELRAQALRVREALGETLPSIARSRETLVRVATPSLAALQLYSRAATLLNGDYWLDLDPLRIAASKATPPGASRYDAAEALLREATQADPTFASAWLLLAHVVWNRTFPGTDYLPFVDRALQHADAVGPAERYFIQGFAERRQSYVDPVRDRHLEAAARAYEGLLQLHPDHDWALLELEQVYLELGRNDDAERVALRGLSARPHSFRFAVEAAKAHLRRRDRVALEAAATRLLASPLSTEPQTVGGLAQSAAWIRLWAVHDAWLDADVARALREADAADRKWAWDTSRWWLLQMADVYIGLGRFGDARRVAARMAPEYRDWELALVATFREDAREFRRLVHPDRHAFEVLHDRSGMLTMNGWLDTTEWLLAERRRRHVPMGWVEADFDAGLLAVARRHYAEGRALLEPLTRSPWSSNSVLLAYGALAVAQASTGDSRSAIALLEPLGDARAASVLCQWRVYDFLRCRVLLAELYKSSGRQEDALRLAAEVRELLRVSDADHPLLKRVARLDIKGSGTAAPRR